MVSKTKCFVLPLLHLAHHMHYVSTVQYACFYIVKFYPVVSDSLETVLLIIVQRSISLIFFQHKLNFCGHFPEESDLI